MKSVIVTGANGFVGSNIVNELAQLGWFVYAVDLSFDNPIVSTWDVTQIQQVISGCENLPALSADCLVHGAFITAPPEARHETPSANIRANINPMLRMMEYAEENQIGRSIYLSSTGVYRSMPDMMIDETYPQQPLGVYAVAKTMMEHTVETMRTVYQRDIICVRLGNIYGQHEYQRESRPFLSVIGQMIHMATTSNKIIVNRPDENREWTYASDIGRAIGSLLSADRLNHPLYHVASSERKTNLNIAYLIQNILDHVTVSVVKDNNKPLLTRLGNLDNSRLKDDTGFSNWTPLDETVLETILTSMLRSKADA